MALCDCCGAQVPAHTMCQLVKGYGPSDMVDLCPACSDYAERVREKVLAEIKPTVRRALEERRALAQRKPTWMPRWVWLSSRASPVEDGGDR